MSEIKNKLENMDEIYLKRTRDVIADIIKCFEKGDLHLVKNEMEKYKYFREKNDDIFIHGYYETIINKCEKLLNIDDKDKGCCRRFGREDDKNE